MKYKVVKLHCLTIMRYHFTPIIMATIKIKNKTENNKGWRGCGETGTLMLCR